MSSMRKKKVYRLVSLGVAAVAMLLWNAGATASTSIQVSVPDIGALPVTEEPVLKELADEFHYLSHKLTSKQSAHYYGFTARRGQKVVLATPAVDLDTVPWKLEYHENGTWKEKRGKFPQVFSNLRPGDFVIVRVTHREDKTYSANPYTVVLGSFPVMNDANVYTSDMVKRVPAADTSRVLGVQTYSDLQFRAKFTDSTGHPLKGAGAMIHLFLKAGSTSPDLKKYAFSDYEGNVNFDIPLGKCSVGEMSVRQNEPNAENRHWLSTYNVAGWYAFEVFFESQKLTTETPYVLGIAHICSQRLEKGTVDRW